LGRSRGHVDLLTASLGRGRARRRSAAHRSAADHQPATGVIALTVHTLHGSPTVIALSGDLDLASAPQFQSEVDRIDFSSVTRLILDLRELTFIDAAGLHSVLRLQERCLARSVALAIRPGRRAVQRVFELTRTDRLLPFTRFAPENADPW
jgi:anti-sigma B factor antagonist